MKKLYFIENIHTVSLSNEERDVKYTITLEDVERSEKIALSLWGVWATALYGREIKRRAAERHKKQANAE